MQCNVSDVNAQVGGGLLLSTFFVAGAWGSGAGFQAVFTAMSHLAYCAYLMLVIRKQEMARADFLGKL